MIKEEQLKKSEREETNEEKLLHNTSLVAKKRPAARDGHSGISFLNSETNKPYMLIFGGDRH